MVRPRLEARDTIWARSGSRQERIGRPAVSPVHTSLARPTQRGCEAQPELLSAVTQVMGQNGVSHQVVADDLEGVKAVLTWLAYAPPHTGAAPPPLPTSDPIGRPVGYQAPQGMRKE